MGSKLAKRLASFASATRRDTQSVQSTSTQTEQMLSAVASSRRGRSAKSKLEPGLFHAKILFDSYDRYIPISNYEPVRFIQIYAAARRRVQIYATSANAQKQDLRRR